MTGRLQLGVAFGLGVVMTAGVGALVLNWRGAPVVDATPSLESTTLPSTATEISSTLAVEPVGFLRMVPESHSTDLPEEWPETNGERESRLQWERDNRIHKLGKGGWWHSSPFDTAMLLVDGPLDRAPLALVFPDDSASAANAGINLRKWGETYYQADPYPRARHRYSGRETDWDQKIESAFFPIRCGGQRSRSVVDPKDVTLAVDNNAVIECVASVLPR